MPDLLSKISVSSNILVNAGLTRSSWEKLSSAVNCFEKFEHDQRKKFDWPLSHVVIVEFCTWAFSKQLLKASSIKAYVSAIATVHRLMGLEEKFSGNYLVKLALRGAENMELYKARPRFQRRAMSVPLLKIIGNEIAVAAWSKVNKQVFWVACTVAFFGSCRMGELLCSNEKSFDPFTTLFWRDLTIRKDSITIHIKAPKSRNPAGEFIDLFCFSDVSCCPVKSMSLLQVLSAHSKLNSNPVFMFDTGKLLTKQNFNVTVRKLLSKRLDLSADLISGHSFRQAIPTILAKHPDLVRDNHIMGWGRWCSSAYLCYTTLQLNQKKCIFGKIADVINKDA